jgi:hypothetical protein
MKTAWKTNEHVDITEFNASAVDITTEAELLQLCKHVIFPLFPYLC